MLSPRAYQYFLDQYDEDYCTGIIQHCLNGRSPESYAAEINSTPEVFAYWAIKHPEFEISIHIAFWKSFAWWEDQLRINPDIDAKIYKMVMGQRFKWSENGSDAQKMLRSMSEKELEDLARRLLSGETIGIMPPIKDDEDIDE